jgi:hypothetical protein
VKIIFDEPTPRLTVAEKISRIEEARQDAIEAEKDFRRCGMTTYAHDAALFIVKCDEEIAVLKEKKFADELIAATEPSLRGFGS